MYFRTQEHLQWEATGDVPVSEITREVENNQRLRSRQLAGGDLRSVVELIASSFLLTDTERYIVMAGVADDLAMPNVTCFFPWDPAWTRLDAQLVARLRSPSWRAHLFNLVFYHLYSGNLPPEAIPFEGDVASVIITMANGEDVNLTTSTAGVRIRANGIEELSRARASNGYAYMLDEVLLPAWASTCLSQILLSSVSCPTLAELLLMTGLENILSDTESFCTVFCPSEAAWAKLSDAEVGILKNPDYLDDLTTLLSHHVVASAGPIPAFLLDPPGRSSFYPDGLDTIAGSKVFINRELPTLRIEGHTKTANLVQGDAIVASNGVVHIISEVLWLPPAFCSINPVCDLLGLDGLCCNTVDDVSLDCCNPPELCVDNPACFAENLLESCCPTDDGVFLACCGATSEAPSKPPCGSP